MKVYKTHRLWSNLISGICSANKVSKHDIYKIQAPKNNSVQFHQPCQPHQTSRLPAKTLTSNYRKNSKNWDTLNYQRDCPTNGIVGFYSAILRSKDADRITNRVDTDQTAPRGGAV